VYPINPQGIFYNDLADSIADALVSKLRVHSYRTFRAPVTVEPWATIPSSYLICEKDQAIAAAAQDFMINQAKSIAPSSFDLVERLDSGHSPFLSQPEKVAEYLERAAGGVWEERGDG
jgi:pimeloyl-ACP methyl ester carboxylesterase